MTSASVSSVQAAVEALRKAMISGDRTELAKCASEELIYRHSTGRSENKQQFIDGTANGSSKISDAVVSDQTVTLIDNVAVVDHVLKRVPRMPAPGKEGGSSMKVLAVWMLRDGQWKMVARHSVKI